MLTFHNLPEGVPISKDLKDRAVCYVEVQYMGKTYYVSVSKRMASLLGIKSTFDGYKASSYKSEERIEEMLRDIVAAIYLQVRDTVGAEIGATLSRQIQDQFSRLFQGQLGDSIQKGLDQKLGIETPSPFADPLDGGM